MGNPGIENAEVNRWLYRNSWDVAISTFLELGYHHTITFVPSTS